MRAKRDVERREDNHEIVRDRDCAEFVVSGDRRCCSAPKTFDDTRDPTTTAWAADPLPAGMDIAGWENKQKRQLLLRTHRVARADAVCAERLLAANNWWGEVFSRLLATIPPPTLEANPGATSGLPAGIASVLYHSEWGLLVRSQRATTNGLPAEDSLGQIL